MCHHLRHQKSVAVLRASGKEQETDQPQAQCGPGRGHGPPCRVRTHVENRGRLARWGEASSCEVGAEMVGMDTSEQTLGLRAEVSRVRVRA